MRISAELLSLDWDNLQGPTEYSILAESLREESTDSNGFLSLERFKPLDDQFAPKDESSRKVS